MKTYSQDCTLTFFLLAAAVALPYAASAQPFCNQDATKGAQASRTGKILGCLRQGTHSWSSKAEHGRTIRVANPTGVFQLPRRHPTFAPVLEITVDDLRFIRSGRHEGRSRTQLSASIRYSVRNKGAADFLLDKAPSGNSLNNSRTRTYFVRITGYDVANGRNLFTLEDRLSNATGSVMPKGNSRSVQRTLTSFRQRTGEIHTDKIPSNLRDIRVTAEIILNVDRCYSMARTRQTFEWTWLAHSSTGYRGEYVPRLKVGPAAASTFNYSTQTSCPNYVL